MSPPISRRVAIFFLVTAVAVPVHASDLSAPPTLKVSLIPRKTTNPPDRRSAVMQRTRDFALSEAQQKRGPSSAGHVYLVEQNNGQQLLLFDLWEGTRGWAPVGAVVPLSAAEEFFSAQIKANPSNAFAFLMRGVARCENDDLAQAGADIDEAIRLEPMNVAALLERAYLWQWRGQLDSALADVCRAIELAPRNSYAFLERAVFECNRKEFDKCLRDLNEAEKLGSKAAIVHVCRGMVALERGERKKAHDELDQAIQIDRKQQDAYCGMASLYLMRGDTKKALKVLDQAVEAEPTSPDAHGNRAVVYLAMHKYDKALDDLDDVLKAAPGSARALRQRAWILATCSDARVRNGELAVISAKSACDATEWKEHRCLATLAAACAEVGDFDGAINWQQQASNLLDYKHPDRREYARILERYQAKKPYRQLGLLQELGIASSNPEPKKSQ